VKPVLLRRPCCGSCSSTRLGHFPSRALSRHPCRPRARSWASPRLRGVKRKGIEYGIASARSRARPSGHASAGLNDPRPFMTARFEKTRHCLRGAACPASARRRRTTRKPRAALAGAGANRESGAHKLHAGRKQLVPRVDEGPGDDRLRARTHVKRNGVVARSRCRCEILVAFSPSSRSSMPNRPPTGNPTLVVDVGTKHARSSRPVLKAGDQSSAVYARMRRRSNQSRN